MPQYTIKEGECLSSIAQRHGLFWKKIWDHPNNSDLKRRRKDPNILYPGDVVFIPEKEEKQENGSTEQRHHFRKKGVPAKVRLRLMRNDQPRANESYVLEVDGIFFAGTTDADGKLEQSIPPNAKKGKLFIGKKREEYILNLGHMDPLNELIGIQKRLNNLGFHCGPANGVLGPRTTNAFKAFQKKHHLTESGEADEATKNKLTEIYGS
ncbi:MAG: peptidoglycan-binding protein [Thermodesulfobacteriota bacterium]|nr:peptidoglycan-binding protein [Thermodesulfobacteriota bacterium]